MGYDTYDYLPSQSKKVKYPFVYIGNLEEISSQTKTNLTGSVVLSIDCWGTPKQRLIISEMVERFFYASIGHVSTENYRFYGNAQQQSKRMQLDTSVPNSTLMRGMVTIELQIL
nr:hypothetical protein [Pediococcus pentosaceus]